jgi:hypothetical protein
MIINFQLFEGATEKGFENLRNNNEENENKFCG